MEISTGLRQPSLASLHQSHCLQNPVYLNKQAGYASKGKSKGPLSIVSRQWFTVQKEEKGVVENRAFRVHSSMHKEENGPLKSWGPPTWSISFWRRHLRLSVWVIIGAWKGTKGLRVACQLRRKEGQNGKFLGLNLQQLFNRRVPRIKGEITNLLYSIEWFPPLGGNHTFTRRSEENGYGAQCVSKMIFWLML